MVEMLGVLAVVGVLSVAGIQGYRMAMTHYMRNDRLNLFASIHTAVNASLMNPDSALYCCSHEEGRYNQCGSGAVDWQSEQYDEICTFLDAADCNIRKFELDFPMISEVNTRDKDLQFLHWQYMTLNRPNSSCGPAGQFYGISMTFKNQQLCRDIYESIIHSPLSDGLAGVSTFRTMNYCIHETSSTVPCSPWSSNPYYSFTLYYYMNNVQQCFK